MSVMNELTMAELLLAFNTQQSYAFLFLCMHHRLQYQTKRKYAKAAITKFVHLSEGQYHFVASTEFNYALRL